MPALEAVAIASSLTSAAIIAFYSLLAACMWLALLLPVLPPPPQLSASDNATLSAYVNVWEASKMGAWLHALVSNEEFWQCLL
mmetsp:Transcript_26655/g.68455  ORF Transcript_26655/g.68455 Transcript_26655/m.68455 type:complete len:83 (+) Transcript_26655:1225-1473(+)